MAPVSGRSGKAYRLPLTRRVKIAIAFLTFSVLAQSIARADCSTSWTMLQPGIDYRQITCLGDDEDVDLYVVRVDPQRWDLDTAVVDRATAQTIAQRHQASFAINANFFDSHYEPIGAIVRGGTLVHAPHRSGWQSIFLIDDSAKPHIVMPSKWASWRGRAQMAVQAGPRLVVAGHANKGIHNNYAAPRAGVCIQNDGSLLFFATPHTRKFQMTEIARVARRDEIDGGLACRDAMLFDGGHSVNLFAAGDDKRIDVEGDPVPVFLYATPHGNSQ